MRSCSALPWHVHMLGVVDARTHAKFADLFQSPRLWDQAQDSEITVAKPVKIDAETMGQAMAAVLKMMGQNNINVNKEI